MSGSVDQCVANKLFNGVSSDYEDDSAAGRGSLSLTLRLILTEQCVG